MSLLARLGFQRTHGRRPAGYDDLSIFENSNEAILLTEPSGTIFAANRAACEMFGMSEDEIRRAGRQGVQDPNDPRHAAAVEERRRTGKVKYE